MVAAAGEDESAGMSSAIAIAAKSRISLIGPRSELLLPSVKKRGFGCNDQRVAGPPVYRMVGLRYMAEGPFSRNTVGSPAEQGLDERALDDRVARAPREVDDGH